MALDPAHPGKKAFIQDALTLTRQRRLYLASEVIYTLINEALELLYRRESEEERSTALYECSCQTDGTNECC